MINNSFDKYGIENHTFEIIEECEVDELDCRERYWQDFYDVLNGGLNLMLQECGEKRRELSEDTIKRKREASTGEKNAMYGKESPFKGKKHTEENKKKSSDRMKGKYKGEDNPFFGKTHSEDTLQILSNKAKERIGEKNGFFGKSHTDEYKKLSSERVSKMFEENPEMKQYLKQCLSIGTYYTPKGAFISQRDAAKANNVNRTTIRSRCVKNSDKKVGYNNQIPIEYRGEHTWREIGWYFIEKDKKE